jgi:hypothetical protein
MPGCRKDPGRAGQFCIAEKENIMTRQKFLAISLIVASAATAANAESLNSFVKGTFHHTPKVTAVQSADTVQVSFRNWQFVPRYIQVGESTVRIEPNSTRTFRVSVGTPVYITKATEKHASGSLLLQVSDKDSGNTILVD